MDNRNVMYFLRYIALTKIVIIKTKNMKVKNIIKNYFEDNPDKINDYLVYDKHKTITIRWALETSDEETIKSNFEETYGEKPNGSDWDVINDNIVNFESDFDMGNFGFNVINEGHNEHDDLVGDIDVTVNNLVSIINEGEDIGGAIVFSTANGTLDIEDLELHDAVDAQLIFHLQTDLYEKIRPFCV
jgi:hypothetical protein